MLGHQYTASQMQSWGGDYIKIPNANSIITTYQIDGWPTVIVITPNRNISNKDVWPLSNTTLRAAITTAGGVAQGCNTSIEEPETSVFSIFPNPVEEMMYITSEGNATVEIFDITGRKVDSFYVGSSAAYNSSHLQSGMYLIRAVNEEGKVISVKKILKQ